MPGLGRRLIGAALAGAGAGIVQQAQQRREDTLLALRRQWQVADRESSQAHASQMFGLQAGLTREGWDRADARADATAPLIPMEGPEGRPVYGTRADARGTPIPTQSTVPPPPEDLIEIIGEDGRPVLVRESEAVGRAPYHHTPDKLIMTGEDPVTGARTWDTEANVRAGIDPQRTRAAAEEAEIEAQTYVEDNRGMFGWGNDEKFGGDPETFQIHFAQVRNERPDASTDAVAAEAKRRTAGNQSDGPATAQPDTEARPPPGLPANARQAPPGTTGAGRWFVPDGRGGWQEWTP